MKSSFVLLFITLSLLDSTGFVSPIQPPEMSPSQPPVLSPSQPPVMSPTSEPPTSEPSNSNCSSVIYSMVDCISFLLIGSTDPSPTKTCCGGIRTVLVYNPQCFCSGLESSREMGFELDDKKALAMPKTCNVPIDPHCANPAALTPKPPKTSPSSAKSPTITPSSPTVAASSPAVTGSSQNATTSSPAATSPSPLISSSRGLAAVMIVSSFIYISS